MISSFIEMIVFTDKFSRSYNRKTKRSGKGKNIFN